MRLEYVVKSRPRLFEGWVDNAIRFAITYPIYSLDSVIRPLYNWAQVANKEMTRDSAKSYVEKLEFD